MSRASFVSTFGKSLLAGMLIAVLFSLRPALAASVQLSSHSVRDMGLANAGGAALSEDASALFANPAALAKLNSAEAVIGAIGMLFKTEAQDRGSTNVLGAPIGGSGSKEFARDSLIPDAFLAVPVTSNVTFGLGITVPFGLDVEYGGGWVGRYQDIGAKILSIDINPSLGVKLTDWARLGVGFSAQYTHAAISNTVDFGTVCLSAASLSACAAAGLLPGQADGYVRVRGSDWAFGWNAGLLFDLDAKTSLGLSYRSRVRQKLSGDATFTVPAQAALLVPLSGGAFVNTSARAMLTMPDTATASLSRKLTDAVTVFGTLQWMGWSSVQALTVRFGNPAQPAQIEPLRYKDVLRGALGLSYALNARTTLRGGLAYEESPARATPQTARIPDTDRYIAAVGASFALSDRLNLDVAYRYMKFHTFAFNQTGALGDQLSAVYRANVQELGVAARWTF